MSQKPTLQPVQDPGRILGWVGLVFSLLVVTWFIGVLVSAIGFVISRRSGYRNRVALAGMVIGGVWLVVLAVALLADLPWRPF